MIFSQIVTKYGKCYEVNVQLPDDLAFPGKQTITCPAEVEEIHVTAFHEVGLMEESAYFARGELVKKMQHSIELDVRVKDGLVMLAGNIGELPINHMTWIENITTHA